MGVTSRSAGYYDAEPEPEVETPPHASRCEPHRLYYRAPRCPKCADAERERALGFAPEAPGHRLNRAPRMIAPRILTKRAPGVDAPGKCRRGHLWREHGRRNTTGSVICRECERVRQGAARAARGRSEDRERWERQMVKTFRGRP